MNLFKNLLLLRELIDTGKEIWCIIESLSHMQYHNIWKKLYFSVCMTYMYKLGLEWLPDYLDNYL